MGEKGKAYRSFQETNFMATNDIVAISKIFVNYLKKNGKKIIKDTYSENEIDRECGLTLAKAPLHLSAQPDGNGGYKFTPHN